MSRLLLAAILITAAALSAQLDLRAISEWIGIDSEPTASVAAPHAAALPQHRQTEQGEKRLIIGDDDREDMSSREIAATFSFIGAVTTKPHAAMPSMQTGSVIGTRKHVLTSAHMFIDAESRELRWSKPDGSIDVEKLAFYSWPCGESYEIRSIELGTRSLRFAPDKDFAVVELARPVCNRVRPAKFGTLEASEIAYAKQDGGITLLMLQRIGSIEDASRLKWIKDRDPQRFGVFKTACRLTRTERPAGIPSAGKVHFNDCDVVSGGSGGPLLIQRGQDLVVFGIIAGAFRRDIGHENHAVVIEGGLQAMLAELR